MADETTKDDYNIIGSIGSLGRLLKSEDSLGFGNLKNSILTYPVDLVNSKDSDNSVNNLRYMTYNFFDPNDTWDKIVGDVKTRWNNSVSSFDDIGDIFKSIGNFFKGDEVGAGGSTFSWDKVNYLCSINLPLPNQLSDAQTHNWNQKSVAEDNFFGQLANGLANTTGGAVANGIQIYGQKTSKGNFSAREYAPTTPTVDKLYWQQFTSSEPRSFTFSYSMIPRNQEEAKIITTIIYIFKKLSSGNSAGGGFFIQSPARCKITFSNPYLDALISAGVVVITGVKLDYNSGNTVGIYQDGFFKKVTLDIECKEFRSKYNQDYALTTNTGSTSASTVASSIPNKMASLAGGWLSKQSKKFRL